MLNHRRFLVERTSLWIRLPLGNARWYKEASVGIKHISAVTFAVRDMERAIEFYEKLGFSRLYGGKGSGFSSLRAWGCHCEPCGNPGASGCVVGARHLPG